MQPRVSLPPQAHWPSGTCVPGLRTPSNTATASLTSGRQVRELCSSGRCLRAVGRDVVPPSSVHLFAQLEPWGVECLYRSPLSRVKSLWTDKCEIERDSLEPGAGAHESHVTLRLSGMKESLMAERTILVCDICGQPAAQTVTFKVGRRNLQKDYCSVHLQDSQPVPGLHAGVADRELWHPPPSAEGDRPRRLARQSAGEDRRRRLRRRGARARHRLAPRRTKLLQRPRVD
jgi:hypothetical protein